MVNDKVKQLIKKREREEKGMQAVPTKKGGGCKRSIRERIRCMKQRMVLVKRGGKRASKNLWKKKLFWQ